MTTIIHTAVVTLASSDVFLEGSPTPLASCSHVCSGSPQSAYRCHQGACRYAPQSPRSRRPRRTGASPSRWPTGRPSSPPCRPPSPQVQRYAGLVAVLIRREYLVTKCFYIVFIGLLPLLVALYNYYAIPSYLRLTQVLTRIF